MKNKLKVEEQNFKGDLYIIVKNAAGNERYMNIILDKDKNIVNYTVFLSNGDNSIFYTVSKNDNIGSNNEIFKYLDKDGKIKVWQSCCMCKRAGGFYRSDSQICSKQIFMKIRERFIESNKVLFDNILDIVDYVNKEYSLNIKFNESIAA